MTTKPITLALAKVERKEPGANEELWDLVYQDLKQLAARRLNKMAAGETLQATALVHEAWLRLGGEQPKGWQGRSHFFGAAALSMRNILVDDARRKKRLRRNEGKKPEPLTANLIADDSAPSVDVLALDEALSELAKEYERPARVVMLRFFAGLTIPEIAELLDVTSRTVDREFLFARLWLRRFIGD